MAKMDGTLREGATTGTVAWLVGLGVALAIWLLFSASGGPLQSIASGIVFYYSMHLWPVIPGVGAGAAILAIFAPLPALVLFWAGFRVTVGSDVASGAEGFRHGAGVVVGYFALSLLCLPAFAIAVSSSPLSEPAVTAVIVGTTGLAFPVVFGGLGGWIAGR
jgi:hypothetical protein